MVRGEIPTPPLLSRCTLVEEASEFREEVDDAGVNVVDNGLVRDPEAPPTSAAVNANALTGSERVSQRLRYIPLRLKKSSG